MSSMERQSLVDPTSKPKCSEIIKTRRFVLVTLILISAVLVVALIVTQIAISDDTPNDFSELTDFCSSVPPISKEERNERLKRMGTILESNHIDVLVLEPGANMIYFTGVKWGRSERPFLFVYHREGDKWKSTWICPAFEERTARQQTGMDADIWGWEEHESPYQVLADAIGINDTSSVHLNFSVDDEIRFFIIDGIEKLLDVRVKNSVEGIASLRMRKSEAELALLDCANRATKRAIKLVARNMRKGISTREVTSLLFEAQLTAGLTNIWALVLFGPDASYPHGSEVLQTLEEGNLILIDTGGALHGYQSDISRTFPFGKPSDDQRKAWETVKKAQEAAFATMAPNVTCGTPEGAARKVITEAGYGDDYKAFTHRLGHGIGLQVHEFPYLVRGNNRLLAPGMTFSNEPGIYLPGKMGIRLEDIVTITDEGARIFGPVSHSIDDPFANH